MICMYLLGNPDHYKSHQFHLFYWQSFVQECRKPWVHQDPAGAGIIHEESDKPDKVAVVKHNGRVIGLSPVLDYVFRPEEISSMSLYEWITICEHEKKPTGNTKKQSKRRTMTTLSPNHETNMDDDFIVDYHSDPDCDSKPNKHCLLSFPDGHPLADSHGTHCRSPTKAR
jgi:hypothetical protein